MEQRLVVHYVRRLKTRSFRAKEIAWAGMNEDMDMNLYLDAFSFDSSLINITLL